MSPELGSLLLDHVVPRIHSAARHCVQPVGAEDADEIAQDAIAMAARMLQSAHTAGKKVTAGNVVFYALQSAKSGRRSVGNSATDVMATATQLHGRSRVVSLEEPLGVDADTEEPACLHETLAAHVEDPATAAARRLDWAALLSALNATECEVLICLSQGQDLTTLVAKIRRSRSSLQEDKHRLARLVCEHLGPDILQQVQSLPGWMNNVTAYHERLACRAERQAA